MKENKIKLAGRLIMTFQDYIFTFTPTHFALFLLLFLSCDSAKNRLPLQAQPSIASSIQISKQETKKTSPIHLIDFANFSYPAYPVFGYAKDTKEKIVLKDGNRAYEEDENVGLDRVIYSDITADGEDEAIVILGLMNRSTERPYFVYIYSMENKKPGLLWSFATGDRVYDGLKSIYAQDGILIVEKYIAEDNRGNWFPAYYVKNRYQWAKQKRKFLQADF